MLPGIVGEIWSRSYDQKLNETNIAPKGRVIYTRGIFAASCNTISDTEPCYIYKIHCQHGPQSTLRTLLT